MNRNFSLFKTLALCLLSIATMARAASDADILMAIGQLRNSQPTDDRQAQAAWNAKMDAAWQTLRANPTEAIPLVRQALLHELESQTPDQFFLLDIAHLSMALEHKAAEPLAMQALARIDPAAKIIQYNDQELFYCTYDLAKSGHPEVRGQIDRFFLPSLKGRHIFVPQHFFTVTPELMCVFLYGVTGPDAETHVTRLLSTQPDMRVKLMEVLYSIGSEQSVEAIKDVLARYGDHDTVTRGITVLMKIGGPRGKEIVMGLNSEKFDLGAKKYFESVRISVPQASYQILAKALDEFKGPITKLTDEKLKSRLELMYQNFGKDDELSPSVILKSKLPTAFLIGEMKRIRSRILFRLNQHALEDVEVTNLIINALQFRE